MKSKLSLGTVQFGLAYGINNTRGQIPFEEVRQLLQIAYAAGIDTLDTAFAYGESEKILGGSFDGSMSFRIITKYPADATDSRPMEVWQKSFDRLGRRPIYGYLLHNYHSFRNRLHLVDFLQELRLQGKVQRTGFSLYDPSELEEILKLDLPFEMIQVPFSLLDRRFLPYFRQLKMRGVEIHSRSSFLQGLVFRKLETLPPFFTPALEALRSVRRKAEELGMSVAELCLGFCLAQPGIDRVVIGVDGIENLQHDIASQSAVDKIRAYIPDLADLRLNVPEILNPSLWEMA